MTKEFITKYLQETEEIARKVDQEEIEKFTQILFKTWKMGKKVITIGNGGSSSTASHFASDLLKTVANTSDDKEVLESKKGFKAICLSDNVPALTAWINDSGWDATYKGLLNTLLEPGDTILLVSVHGGSGWSNNMVQAMELAKKRNANILGLAGFDGGKMKEMADSCIVVPKDSTPHVEGFHGVLQHLVVWMLKDLIDKDQKESTINKLQEIKGGSTDLLTKRLIEKTIEEYKQLNNG
ncbi:MAG: SIS domain-containing protein, partial [archaeon]